MSFRELDMEHSSDSIFDTAKLLKIRDGILNRPSWIKPLKRKLVAVDTVSVSLGVGIALGQEAWVSGSVGLTSIVVSVAILLVWLIVLRVADTRDIEVVGSGPEEFVRVLNSTLAFFGLVAIASYVTDFGLARSFVAISLPVGLGFLLLGRYLIRRRLFKIRESGEGLFDTIVVGGLQGVSYFIGQLAKNPHSGFKVIGACVLNGKCDAGEEVAGVPVLGNTKHVIEAVFTTGAKAVVITGVDVVTPDVVKKLSWDLETAGAQVIVAPSITDVAGPRIHTKPVAGLPLLHVQMPGYSGPQHVLKRIFDVVLTSIILAVLAVPMLLVALLTKMTSRGPVFFKQERVGLNGVPFKMLKFRSMVVDAEKRLEEVMGKGSGGMFYKSKNDPRITPVGKFLRRYSIDELPQLFNVLSGSMSLVGPRPQVPLEVAQYDDEIGRRLLVKPGLTGLWQVSGRSDLSLEESVRLDLYYVENWTIAGDIMIMLKTAKAVIRKDGAY